MRPSEISKMPTTITREEMQDHIHSGVKGVHESMLRSYQLLDYVKDKLRAGWCAEAILEMIKSIEER